MKQKIGAALAVFALLAQDAAAAARRVEIAWQELGGFVVEQKVAIALPDGVKLQGEVLAVRPDSLVLDVHKSSDKKLHPKEQTEIPRSAVTEVTLIRERNAVMRIICGVLGAIGGLAAVGALTYTTESLAVFLPGLIIGVPLAAAGGYYAGKMLDRYKTRITIRPEPAVEEE